MEEKRDSSFQEPRQEREGSAMCLGSVASLLLAQKNWARNKCLWGRPGESCLKSLHSGSWSGRLQAGTSLGCVGCSTHSSLHSEIFPHTNKHIINNTHLAHYIQKCFLCLIPSASSTAWYIGTMIVASSQTRKPWALIVWLLPIRT